MMIFSQHTKKLEANPQRRKLVAHPKHCQCTGHKWDITYIVVSSPKVENAMGVEFFTKRKHLKTKSLRL